MNWGGRMSQVLSAWVFCQRYSFLPHSENLQVRLTENFSLTRPGYIDCPLRALENMVQFLPYHLFIFILLPLQIWPLPGILCSVFCLKWSLYNWTKQNCLNIAGVQKVGSANQRASSQSPAPARIPENLKKRESLGVKGNVRHPQTISVEACRAFSKSPANEKKLSISFYFDNLDSTLLFRM